MKHTKKKKENKQILNRRKEKKGKEKEEEKIKKREKKNVTWQHAVLLTYIAPHCVSHTHTHSKAIVIGFSFHSTKKIFSFFFFD